MALLAVSRKGQKWILSSLVFMFGYFAIGLSQRIILEAHMHEVAKSRGHTITKIEVKPSFANLVVWRSIYQSGDMYYADALHRWPWSSSIKLYSGESIPALDLSKHFPMLPEDSVARKDIERFRWFSSGYLSVDPAQPHFIGDIRFAFYPPSVQAMWGLVVEPNQPPDQHLKFIQQRGLGDEARAHFYRMLFAKD